jgi:hypothetical protein
MLAQTFSRFLIVANYQLNKDYIAKYLCENKNKPLLQCKGKCQMMKKLQQEEKKDQENPERKSENKFEIISFQKDQYSLTCFNTSPAVIFPVTKESISSPILSAPFHPPQS